MAWSPPGSGSLRASVRFERIGSRENVGGVVKATWAPLAAKRSVRLMPIDGVEREVAGRVTRVERWELTVRYDSAVAGVTPDDRVVDRRDDKRVFDIVSVLDVQERGRWLVMTLERGAGDGV